jgi:hypothetical protein
VLVEKGHKVVVVDEVRDWEGNVWKEISAIITRGSIMHNDSYFSRYIMALLEIDHVNNMGFYYNFFEIFHYFNTILCI